MNFETTRPTPLQARLRMETGITSGSVNKLMKAVNAVPLIGYQIRYIYLVDKSCKITVPTLPFSKIDEMGARMYKGKRLTSIDSDALSFQDEEGGAAPTVRL